MPCWIFAFPECNSAFCNNFVSLEVPPAKCWSEGCIFFHERIVCHVFEIVWCERPDRLEQTDGAKIWNCVAYNRFGSLALQRFVFIAACVSLLTASIESIGSKLCVACGRKCLHAVVRVFRLACSRSFVCRFWPQVLTPSRGSRSWWINVCKYLFWLEIYCLLSLN